MLRGGASYFSGMKILLDECVPWPMHKLLTGHDCQSAKQRGWGGIKNGELLRLAESEYDLFITADQNIRYQQNLTGRTIAILELSTNNLHRISAAAERMRDTIANMSPNGFCTLEIP